jgi:hypothetical protein
VHVPGRDDETVVGRVTVHRERHSAFLDSGVRDERVVDARR